MSSYPIILFGRTTGHFGYELWATDGTAGHETILTDSTDRPGATNVVDVHARSSNPQQFTVFDGKLYFSADWEHWIDTPGQGIGGYYDGHGYEPSVSDGFGAGILKDIGVDPDGSTGRDSDPSWFTVAGNQLFFFAYDGYTASPTGDELYVTDGTTGGTHLVKDIVPGPNPGIGGNNPSPYGMAALGSEVYFVAVDPNDSGGGTSTQDYALWKSDGTDAGTVIVKNLWPGGGNDPGIHNLTAVGSYMFFSGSDGVNGNELWRTDGTDAGTIMLTDRQPTDFPSNPQNLFNDNGVLLFSAIDDHNGEITLWRSDGTVNGTFVVKDITTANNDANPHWFVNSHGETYFVANDGVHGNALWETDGTADGTMLASALNPNGPMVDVNGVLYFGANDGVNGTELWKFDDNTAEMVADINPGAGSSNPNNLTNVDGVLYFIASDGSPDNNNGESIALWKSDGTPDGTVKLVASGNGPISFLEIQNIAPTDISLSGNFVPENSPVDTLIGTLSDTDRDLNETATFSIQSDPDHLFKVEGNQLLLNGPVDFEQATSHNVTIRATDSAGNTFDKQFAIGVGNVNEPPVIHVTDQTATLVEAGIDAHDQPIAGVSTASVTVTVTDPDQGDTPTLTLQGAGPDVSGAALYNGHYYEFIGGAYTWDQANADAAARGGYLATITSAGENSFIQSLIPQNNDNSPITPESYIGASDAAQEGVWKWVAGPEAGQNFWNGDYGQFAPAGQQGTPAVVQGFYANWDTTPDDPNVAQEPNNLLNQENYGVFYADGTWNDGTDGTDHGSGPVPLSYILEFSAPFNVRHGTYGSLQFDPQTGVATYTLDNSLPATEALANGQVVTDAFDFQSSDGHGGTTTKTVSFTIDGTDDTTGNLAPTDIALSNNAIAENNSANAVVGMLSASDPDSQETFTFTLLDDAGGRFAIANVDNVVATGPLDYETGAHSYDVMVRVTDSANHTFDKTLTVNVTDVNEPPTAIALNNTMASIAENTSTTTHIKVADIAVTDDALGTDTLGLTGADAASFEIAGNALFLKAGTTLDFEIKSSYSVAVTVDDTTVGVTPDATSQAYTLHVTDVNEPPTAVTLNNTMPSIAENTSTTTHIKVADIAVTDDALGTDTLGLSGADAASFEIAGNSLFLKADITLDFETKSSYSVAVTVNDPSVGSTPDATSQTYTLHVGNLPELSTLNPGPFGDFDHDGTADLLWRNDDGTVETWKMSGGAVAASTFLGGVTNDWHIQGVGDFNNDGMADILWRNEDGTLLDWQMTSSSQVGSAFGVGTAPANSTLAGIGDVDGDHLDDLLWRDNTSGAVTINSFNSTHTTISGVGNEWSVVGVGDYNGDGKADVMFRNDSLGVNAAWLMNGTGNPTTVFYNGVPTDWHVAGSGDFDGNGTADLFWHNDNGANAVWLTNTLGAVQATAFFDGVGSDWHVVGTGDVSGDHKDDVIWRNDAGATAIWQMNGAGTPNVTFPGGAPTDWQTQAHHYDFA